MSKKSFLPYEADSDESRLFIWIINAIVTLLIPLILFICAIVSYVVIDGSTVPNVLFFSSFAWIGVIVISSVKSVETNERGIITFFGQYLGEVHGGFIFLTPIFTLEKISSGNIMFQFSPRPGERKGDYAQTVWLSDITTAGPTDASWKETYWQQKDSADPNAPTIKEKIIKGEYNKRVTLDPSVAFILKIDKPGLFMQNIPGKNVRARMLEVERQLHTLANTILNREFKKRVYGQLVNMMTIDNPTSELNLDTMIKEEMEVLIDGKGAKGGPEDPTKSWGFNCINAWLPKLSAPKVVHDATNDIQKTVLDNLSKVAISETYKTTKKNEGDADSTYLEAITTASKKAGIDATIFQQMLTDIKVATGANRTVIMNGGKGNTEDALLLEILAELKEQRINKPTSKTA